MAAVKGVAAVLATSTVIHLCESLCKYINMFVVISALLMALYTPEHGVGLGVILWLFS
ncbi:hypothetical protein [Aeromonas veronii]|uniref:hypothetical protein n=1 Tax=Aeromonas veronii TaxID=654 RepID=UPI00137AEFB8|nr:hypothetical protein [Aeromonas veronii]